MLSGNAAPKVSDNEEKNTWGPLAKQTTIAIYHCHSSCLYP
jgi:hypothetical protein